MTPEWKSFLVRTGILALVVVAVSALSGYILRVVQYRQVLAAQTRARDFLTQAQAQFTIPGDTDIVTRISTAQELAATAMTTLRASPIRPASTLAISARRCADDLAWLRDALPPLQLLAGYDAASDVGHSTDRHDLIGRFYLARKGLQRVLTTLANPPADLTTDSVARALAQTRTLQGQTAPIIRLLDSGDMKNAHTLAQQFIHDAQIATKDATEVLRYFTDPQLLVALCGTR